VTVVSERDAVLHVADGRNPGGPGRASHPLAPPSLRPSSRSSSASRTWSAIDDGDVGEQFLPLGRRRGDASSVGGAIPAVRISLADSHGAP
jgi:hypothetical protein